MTAKGHSHVSEFTVAAGETVDLTMTWFPAHRPAPASLSIDEQFAATTQWWEDWARSCKVPERYGEIVERSLLVLRALTHEDTGGIVAAATTSLPEEFGGSRN